MTGTKKRKSSVTRKKNKSVVSKPKLKQVDTSPIRKHYLLGIEGRSNFSRFLVDNYFNKLNLEKHGFSEDPSDDISYSYSRKRQATFKAHLDFVPSLATVTLFIAGHIGLWAFGKTLDELYTGIIRPKAVDLYKKMAQKDGHFVNLKTHFDVSVWSEQLKTMVVIRIISDTPKDFMKSDKVVTTAHAQAIKWIEKNGVSKKHLLICIRNGVIDEIPLLSDDYPKVTSHKIKLMYK